MTIVSKTMTVVSQTMTTISQTMSIVSQMGVSGSEVAQTVDVVETKTNCVSDHDTNTGFSIGAPLAKTLRRPGHKGSGDSWMESNTGSVSVSVERSSQVSVSVIRISLGFSLPLVDDVDSSQRTAAIAGGIQTQ